MNLIIILFTVLFIWNLFTFVLMGADKFKAIKKKWRISEKTLFTISILFGGIGVASGMSLFRHKTKHMSFQVIIPFAVVINIISIVYILKGLKYLHLLF